MVRPIQSKLLEARGAEVLLMYGTPTPAAAQQVVNCRLYCDGRAVRDIDIDHLDEVPDAPGQLIWIGLYDPDEEVLSKVQRRFGLHELAIEDAHLMLASVKSNEVMKKLAGWAAILAVPTAIAGIYGMNFRFMPELEWTWGYPATLFAIVAICGYLYYRFHKSGWL
jgi:Mg2+ and Co2+ transporter CorA